jgi:hypothetical protein
MRRIIKKKTSLIFIKKWKYKDPKKGGSNVIHNRKIRAELDKEQNYFCAYTEERLSVTYARDIEHFNPTLKLTPNDGYRNYFAVSHLWNIEKGTKWTDFQPIMHPTDLNFEKRLWYNEGIYDTNSWDIRADNLRKYLDLNNEALVRERKNYIKGLKALFDNRVEELKDFLLANPDFIRFPSAIAAEFNIQL